MMDSEKVCHSRENGNPEAYNHLKTLDSRFHGNDKIVHILTFYEFVNNREWKENRNV